VRLDSGAARPALCVAGEIRRAVSTLVANAVEAAGPAGAVRVAIHDRGPDVVVSVEDTGPGIEPELAERIFHPFFSTRDKGVPSGTGLAIARRIARRFGGDLKLVPTAGPGARFELVLPATDEVPATENAPPAGS
jgi:signal transduction histidine kinase